jgi:hypothetical protein
MFTDGVVGEILFYSLRECVGTAVYTTAMHTTWCKIMSRMLKSMIPVAIAFELKNGSSELQRLRIEANHKVNEENKRTDFEERQQSLSQSAAMSQGDPSNYISQAGDPNIHDLKALHVDTMNVNSSKVAPRPAEPV